MQSITNRYSLNYISVGSVVRREIDLGTPLGDELKGYLERVEEYPADVIGRVMGPRILRFSDKKSVLDGFPKYGREADWFERFSLENGLKLGSVAVLSVTLEEAKRRVVGRKYCDRCHEMVTIEGGLVACVKCGGSLKVRDDDSPEILERRFYDFDVYMSQTLPVLHRIAKSVVEINGMQSKEKVVSDLVDVFELK
jgi:adenylate kinase